MTYERCVGKILCKMCAKNIDLRGGGPFYSRFIIHSLFRFYGDRYLPSEQIINLLNTIKKKAEGGRGKGMKKVHKGEPHNIMNPVSTYSLPS